MALLIKHPILDFGPGHDLTVQVVSSSPVSGSVLTARGLLEILSPSFSAPTLLTSTLSLSLSLSLALKHF